MLRPKLVLLLTKILQNPVLMKHNVFYDSGIPEVNVVQASIWHIHFKQFSLAQIEFKYQKQFYFKLFSLALPNTNTF